jgi:hypothetical protein
VKTIAPCDLTKCKNYLGRTRSHFDLHNKSVEQTPLNLAMLYTVSSILHLISTPSVPIYLMFWECFIFPQWLSFSVTKAEERKTFHAVQSSVSTQSQPDGGSLIGVLTSMRIAGPLPPPIPFPWLLC